MPKVMANEKRSAATPTTFIIGIAIKNWEFMIMFVWINCNKSWST